ncbi:hypothetical protein BJX64DRAFT_68606 [Aspergillus heterothallicus]
MTFIACQFGASPSLYFGRTYYHLNSVLVLLRMVPGGVFSPLISVPLVRGTKPECRGRWRISTGLGDSGCVPWMNEFLSAPLTPVKEGMQAETNRSPCASDMTQSITFTVVLTNDGEPGHALVELPPVTSLTCFGNLIGNGCEFRWYILLGVMSCEQPGETVAVGVGVGATLACDCCVGFSIPGGLPINNTPIRGSERVVMMLG